MIAKNKSLMMENKKQLHHHLHDMEKDLKAKIDSKMRGHLHTHISKPPSRPKDRPSLSKNIRVLGTNLKGINSDSAHIEENLSNESS